MCTHQQTVELQHEAETVCMCCGLVLEKMYGNTHERMYLQNVTATDADDLTFLLEICSSNFIPDRFAYEAAYEFAQMMQKSSPAKLIAKLYNVLLQNNASRTIKNLAYMSGVTNSDIRREVSNIGLPGQANSKDLLHPICAKLHFKRSDICKMDQIIDSVECKNQHLNPLTVIGGVIYQYSKKIKNKISIKDIAEVCDISPMSIYRFNKIFTSSSWNYDCFPR